MEMEDGHGRETVPPGEWRRLLPEYVAAGARYSAVWAVVLASKGIPYSQETEQGQWRLLVPAEQLSAAVREISLYEDENRNWPPLPPLRPALDSGTYTTLSILILLAAFHNLVRSDLVTVAGNYPDWFSSGMMQSGKIMDGEWWRLVTSLTLHADLSHLLGNLCIGGVFVVLLCREMGSGLAWTLLLGAGLLGNLVNGYIQPATHNSIGASTAVFGVVGILAGLSVRRYSQLKKRRWAVPVAAALSLLVLIGSEGKNTDVGAHFFGLLAGLLLGLFTEVLIGRYGYPGRFLNVLLAVCSCLLVVTAWWYALQL
ncbi:rhomboid family intramembrane serine protease [Trichlorobacter lovleyi]|uniref:Rhomboid family protein n=1 Tax=Trichlorobacter lovleyi (strain ATCC BAA-1151 / DSM 17278 / SZ) TaxID=398767 RepID=B3E582_TRIL1|nr:rhomboid family intramembrane serine protease [Trichlorobacter lovleyi]ACD96069.1 Rhomboid family protein [Trichlorobacter lovleyi SZ]